MPLYLLTIQTNFKVGEFLILEGIYPSLPTNEVRLIFGIKEALLLLDTVNSGFLIIELPTGEEKLK
jgi:hypothetical protein